MSSAPRAAAEPARARRTQAERSASTRARLLDATIACLIESGWSGTTTSQIETRAGVSRGARLHHFPDKAALVATAVEHLYGSMAESYTEAMREMGPDVDRFHAGVRLLWGVYKSPSQAATLDLLAAARTDPALAEHLGAVLSRIHRTSRRRANALFPDLATREAEGLLETLQAVLLGLALRRSVFGDAAAEEPVLDLMERMVASHFRFGERGAKSEEPAGTEVRTDAEEMTT